MLSALMRQAKHIMTASVLWYFVSGPGRHGFLHYIYTTVLPAWYISFLNNNFLHCIFPQLF